MQSQAFLPTRIMTSLMIQDSLNCPSIEDFSPTSDILTRNRLGSTTSHQCRLDYRRRNLLKAVFLMLGIGVLVSWNAFISAKNYFTSRLCQLNSAVNDDTVESVFSVVFNLSSVCCLALLLAVQGLQQRRSSRSREVIEMTLEREQDFQNGVLDWKSINSDEFICNSSACDTVGVLAPSMMICDGDNTGGHTYAMVMVSLALNLALFAGETIMVAFINIPPNLFRGLVLTCISLCGVCVAVASAGVTATAGLFPGDWAMNSYLAGQAIGGVLVSLANFVSATFEDPQIYYNAHCQSTDTSHLQQVRNVQQVHIVQKDHRHRYQQETLPERRVNTNSTSSHTCTPYHEIDYAVMCYFILGVLILAVCLIGYVYVDRYQRTVHRDDYETVHDNQLDHHANNNIVAEETITSSTTADQEQSPRIGLELRPDVRIHGNHVCTSMLEERVDDGHWRVDQLQGHPVMQQSTVTHNEVPENINDTHDVFRHIRGCAFAIFFSFFVTLALFPGRTSELSSVRQCQTPRYRIANDLYTPFTFVLFNVGDLTGRIFSAKLALHNVNRLSEKLVAASILRILFLPLLFFCTSGYPDDTQRVQFFVQIHSDLYSVTIQFLLAVTNGLIVSTAFCHAPTLIAHKTNAQEYMSQILTFALSVGLLSGSLFALTIANMTSVA